MRRKYLEPPRGETFSEELKKFSDEIKRCALLIGEDPEELYRSFLKQFKVHEREKFVKNLTKMIAEKHPEISLAERARFRSSFKIYYSLLRLRSVKIDRRIVSDIQTILSETSIYYRSFGKANSSDLARTLRLNMKKEVTTVVKQMILYCLDHFSSGVEISLELIQPDRFEWWQGIVWGGNVRLKAVRDKCIDGKEIYLRDWDGREYKYGVRSFENLVPRVKKEKELAKQYDT